MSDWMPLWTTALGGIIATISGVLSPAIIKIIDYKRNNKIERIIKRRAVADMASDYVIATQVLGQKLIAMEEVVSQGSHYEFPDVDRDDRRSFVGFVMSSHFDAPDAEQECQQLVENCDEYLSRIHSFHGDIYGTAGEPENVKLHNAFVKDHGILLNQIDAAHRVPTKKLAGR